MGRERGGFGGRRGSSPEEHGHAKQREQDENRHEKAGLPRKHVEANDHPDGEDDNK